MFSKIGSILKFSWKLTRPDKSKLKFIKMLPVNNLNNMCLLKK